MRTLLRLFLSNRNDMKFLKKNIGVYMRTDGLHVTKVIDFEHYTEITHETLSSAKSVERQSKSFDVEISEEEFAQVFETVLSKLQLTATL